jgi:hypothetical protein
VYCFAPGPNAFVILVIKFKQVLSTFLRIHPFASAITSSTQSYPSFFIFQFVSHSLVISLLLLSSFETSAQGNESSIEDPAFACIGFPSSPRTYHLGGSTTLIISVLDNSSFITFNVDSFTSLRKGLIGSPTYL